MLNVPDLVAAGSDHVLVVTNHENPSLEGLNRVNQSIHRVQIKMIGGLIQNQDVRVVPHTNRERDSRLLAPTQLVNRCHLHVPGHSEHPQMSPVDQVLLIRERMDHLFQRGLQQVQLVQMMLRKCGDSGSRALKLLTFQ